MVKDIREPIRITVKLNDVLELLKLLARIEYPEVTYCEDTLEMCQQAVRLNKSNADSASKIIYKWTHDGQYIKELVNAN